MKCPLCKEYRCTNIKHIAYKHRLYKAAPALLEACKNIKSLIDLGYKEKVIAAPNNFHVNLDVCLKEIKAAIAAARK